MIGKLVRHRVTNKIGVIIQREQLPLGFPYTFQGRVVSYFPATQEDLLSGEVEIDVRSYEEPHVKVLWNDADKPSWINLKDVEIISENSLTIDKP
jgi:hypothetical protein